MSNPFTQQEIQERFESLPEDVKNVVGSTEVASNIQSIGKEHKLRIDKVGMLVEQAGLIMLGLIKSHEFVNNLTRELEISKEQAESIAIAVDEQVFSRIRGSLRDVQYHSTPEKRFSEGSDLGEYGDSPARDSMIADVERQADESVSADVSSAFSNADYTPTEQQDVPTPTSTSAAPPTTPEATVEVPLNTQAPDNPNVPQHADIESSLPTSSIPAPSAASEELTKDFKQRLEENLQKQAHTVNADPYKESIE